ncbi:3990_t:CDS:2, partial [Racocetra persica]
MPRLDTKRSNKMRPKKNRQFLQYKSRVFKQSMLHYHYKHDTSDSQYTGLTWIGQRTGSAIVDCFGVTRDPTGCYMFVTKFYEYGNLQEFLTKTMGCLCWRDIIDMLWGMISGGLERIHDNGFYHGNLHCEAYSTLMKRCWDENPKNRPKAVELSDILCNWVTAISDNIESTPISEQFDLAEEKRFVDLINKTFTQPAIHNGAIYISRLLDFQSLHEDA